MVAPLGEAFYGDVRSKRMVSTPTGHVDQDMPH